MSAGHRSSDIQRDDYYDERHSDVDDLLRVLGVHAVQQQDRELRAEECEAAEALQNSPAAEGRADRGEAQDCEESAGVLAGVLLGLRLRGHCRMASNQLPRNRLYFDVASEIVLERVKEVHEKKPELKKFYEATNKLLAGIVGNRMKSKIDRTVAATTKRADGENAFARENEEEFKENLLKLRSEKSVKSQKNDNKSNDGNASESREIDKMSEVDREGEEGVRQRNEPSVIKERISISKMKSIKAGPFEEEEPETESIQVRSIGWPKHASFIQKVEHIILYPVNVLLYFTMPIPRVAKEGERNYLPLIYMLCLIWAAGFAFIITWWLVDLSVAFDIPFLILPMFVLPAGLFLRDITNWLKFRTKIQELKQRLKEEESIEKEQAEEKKGNHQIRRNFDRASTNTDKKKAKERIIDQYSGPIFTFTMGTSFFWLIYTLIKGEIVLTSEVIYIQLLILMGLMVIKIIMSIVSGFSAPRWMFFAHIILYVVYLATVLTVELIGFSESSEELVEVEE
eukprot:TRINITY_DN5645_c0_g1_i8.p1 TRINITY_DN5645_c0_g1~~TRINITY_DN5645_c0_g1_i8.p1  ORF type:complete len:512 (-),score=151.48 TRINITY_DN5645_c0_g1_i8:120-1655(-)